MMTVDPLLFQIGSIVGDFELVLKVVGMLFIVSFVRSHIQHPILSVGLIILLCGFLLFDVWKIFGGILLLYLVAFFGFTHILVDLSFMSAFSSPLLNIGGMFRGKPKPQPHPGGEQGYSREELEHMHERQREEEERHHHEQYGHDREHEHQYEGRDHSHEHLNSREMNQRLQYEQQMRMRRGKDDHR